MNQETNDPLEMNESQYLEERVNDQIQYYGDAARRAKRMHWRFQTVLILCAATVPVVINLPKTWGTCNIMAISVGGATILSLVVAGLTGLANFRKDGELWLRYRTTAEMLKHERYFYITRTGRYSETEDAFSAFVANVEGIISSEHSQFRSAMEGSSRPSRERPK